MKKIVRPWVALLLTLALPCAEADAGAAAPFTGAFVGTGRSCSGSLTVRAKAISWLTSFSRCKQVPYEVLETLENGNQRRLSFRFKQAGKACHYQVISLTHTDAANADIGWEVTGYGSLDEYTADKQSGYKLNQPGMMSCPLVRHGKD